MDTFGERPRRKLVATSETVRKRSPETRKVLTAQEEQIGRLARDGLSNPEISSRLFISARTVQYHLARCSPSSASGTRSRRCRPWCAARAHTGRDRKSWPLTAAGLDARL
jgi:hypothetical protein